MRFNPFNSMLIILLLSMAALTTAMGQPAESPADAATKTPTPDPIAQNRCLHSSLRWHGLIDTERECHYDHEHKDNPHAVDDLFGPLSLAQEISYPWQTFSDAGTENELKHGGYGWLVRRDMPCKAAFSEGCLTDFRLQYHAIMAGPGAVTRHHSFWLEARGCQLSEPEVCGIMRTGGWADYGQLEIDGQHVPLANDPLTDTNTGRRIHYYQRGNANFGTWYGGNRRATVALQTNRMWGLVDPANPAALHRFCPENDCRNNNSMMQAHAIGVRVPASLDEDGDGLVTFSGYTNRHGELVSGCTASGLDCVPLEIINMPVGGYQYRDDDHNLEQGRADYDTSPADEFWITYPN